MGRPVVDYVGKVFGMLTVIEFSHIQTRNLTTGVELRQGIPHWLCKCECGNEKVIRAAALRTGNTIACGCMRSHRTHGMDKTKEYYAWSAMKQRCSNPKNQRYKDYGGRGIQVSEEWQKFENFYADMGDAPKGHQIDRTDNDGNYEKGNCKWVTPQENCLNRVRR